VLDQAAQAVTGWTWVLSAVVFGLYLAVVLPAEAARTLEIAGTSETPDTSYRYAPADLDRLADEYGEEGRAHYVRSRFTFDVVWPLVYGTFLQVSVLLAARRSVLGRLPAVVLALPAWAVLFDLLENSSAALVIGRYPDPTPVVPFVAPAATFLKWNALYASFVLAAVGLVAAAVARLRGRVS
jgi:hypothetical protein